MKRKPPNNLEIEWVPSRCAVVEVPHWAVFDRVGKNPRCWFCVTAPINGAGDLLRAIVKTYNETQARNARKI